MLEHQVEDRLTFDKMRPHVPVQWKQVVILFERICAANGRGFIPISGVCPAHDLALLIQPENVILKLPREQHKMVELKKITRRQTREFEDNILRLYQQGKI